MTHHKKIKNYFSKAELFLWFGSVLFILFSFFAFNNTSYLVLGASLIGATSLIFNAKGNPIGQLLMVIFSILYGIISYSFRYFGEMITYMAMTAPMALFSLFSWLKNPYKGNKSEVTVGNLHFNEIIFMFILTGIITFLFYYILKYFNTTNLILSTLSVTTSFLAVYLTFKRSAFYAIAYALNDVILIILWILASISNISYLSVIICFTIFLINDIYGFVNWQNMKKRQST